MPRTTPRLTRDELVTIISDYYHFLTTFYLPPSALKLPPPGGWPNITAEVIKDLDKSPIVIDLIKNLPYIEQAPFNQHERSHDIHYKSGVIDYSVLAPENFTDDFITDGEESLQEWRDEMDAEKGSDADEDSDEEFEETDNWWDYDEPDSFSMSHMLVLAQGHESGGRTLILDVFKGNIYEDVVICNLLSAVPVEDFFADLRGKMERLELVPYGTGMVDGVEDVGDEDERMLEEMGMGARKEVAPGLQMGFEVKRLRRVWRECGWPGEGFRRHEAVGKIGEERVRLGME